MSLAVFFPEAPLAQWTRSAWLVLLNLIPLFKTRLFLVSPFDFPDDGLWSIATGVDLPRHTPSLVLIEFSHDGWYYALSPGPDREYVVFRLLDVAPSPGSPL